MEEFFTQYGPIIVYIAIFLGALVEGESIVLTASILAYRHDSISLYVLMSLAFLGSFSADQSLFFVGRRYGPRIIRRFPSWREATDRVFYHLKRHSTLFIISFRFIYGIRTISPIAIGASGVPLSRFGPLNFFAAIFWAVLSCSLGYYLGYVFDDQLDLFFELLGKYKKTFGAIVVSVILFSVARWYWKQKRR